MHTHARSVMNRVLSPANLRRLRDGFYRDGVRLLDRALEQRSFDAVAELAQPYPLKVFPDAVGIAQDERHKLLAYCDVVFTTMGPKNEFYQAAMSRAAEVIPWVTHHSHRAASRPRTPISPPGVGGGRTVSTSPAKRPGPSPWAPASTAASAR